MQIFYEGSKFSVDEFNIDLKQKIEKQIYCAIDDVTKFNLITQEEAKHLKTQNTIIPTMYALPKTHEDGMPLRQFHENFRYKDIELSQVDCTTKTWIICITIVRVTLFVFLERFSTFARVQL